MFHTWQKCLDLKWKNVNIIFFSFWNLHLLQKYFMVLRIGACLSPQIQHGEVSTQCVLFLTCACVLPRSSTPIQCVMREVETLEGALMMTFVWHAYTKDKGENTFLDHPFVAKWMNKISWIILPSPNEQKQSKGNLDGHWSTKHKDKTYDWHLACNIYFFIYLDLPLVFSNTFLWIWVLGLVISFGPRISWGIEWKDICWVEQQFGCPTELRSMFKNFLPRISWGIEWKDLCQVV